MTFENKAKQKAEILTNDVYINMDGQLAEEEYALMLDWNDEDVAFVREEEYEGRKVWQVYSADGTLLAETESRNFAFILARQIDLVPQSAH